MKRYLVIIIAVIVLFVQLVSLPHAGMTWDEPSSFFFGRANLKFWMTGDRSYLTDFKNPSKFRGDPFQYIYGEDIYPPFSFLVSSATSYVLAEQMHLMTPIDAHHLGQVLIGISGVLAIYGIALLIGFSSGVAAGVTLLYATYPTIIAHMRNDAKDLPLMSMMVVFVYFFLSWITALKKKSKQRHLFGILAAVSLGLAEGTKVSAAIIVPIVMVWLIGSYVFFSSFRKNLGSVIHRLIEGAFFGLISFATFIIIWPWLWDNPIQKLQNAWEFFKVVGFGMPTLYYGEVFQAGVNLPWHYPIGIFLSQTPPTLLPLFIAGCLYAVYRIIKKKDVFALFLLVWFFMGMGRFFLPGVLIYAKIRHFIDAMPPVFLLSGYGAVLLGTLVTRVISMRKKHTEKEEMSQHKISSLLFFLGKQPAVLILSMVIFHQLIIMTTHFPYEPSYFSFFGKGTKQAAEKHLFDVEYWAASVKEGMEAVEKISDKPTTVYACTMAHLAVFYETEKVKVKLTPFESEYILIPNSYSWFGGPAEHAKENHTLVYTVKRNGAPFLWVYKFSSPSFWNCGNETNMNYEF